MELMKLLNFSGGIFWEWVNATQQYCERKFEWKLAFVKMALTVIGFVALKLSLAL